VSVVHSEEVGMAGLISADDQGNVIVAWSDRRNHPGGETGSDVFVNFSSDHARTFQNQDVRVNQTLSSPEETSPVGLSEDCSGRTYLVFLGTRDGWNHLFLNRSLDHGLTWETQDARITNLASSVQDESLVTSRGGHVYVAYSYVSGSEYVNVSCD